MKFINENPMGKKPYWAFGYPYPACANCSHFMNHYSVHENGECSLSWDGFHYRTRYEGDKACQDYAQDKKRLKDLLPLHGEADGHAR